MNSGIMCARSRSAATVFKRRPCSGTARDSEDEIAFVAIQALAGVVPEVWPNAVEQVAVAIWSVAQGSASEWIRSHFVRVQLRKMRRILIGMRQAKVLDCDRCFGQTKPGEAFRLARGGSFKATQ